MISVRYDLNLYIKCKIVLVFKKLMKPNSVTAKLSNFVQTSYFEYRTAYLCVDAEACPAFPLLKSLYVCLHVALNFVPLLLVINAYDTRMYLGVI